MRWVQRRMHPEEQQAVLVSDACNTASTLAAAARLNLSHVQNGHDVRRHQSLIPRKCRTDAQPAEAHQKSGSWMPLQVLLQP